MGSVRRPPGKKMQHFAAMLDPGGMKRFHRLGGYTTSSTFIIFTRWCHVYMSAAHGLDTGPCWGRLKPIGPSDGMGQALQDSPHCCQMGSFELIPAGVVSHTSPNVRLHLLHRVESRLLPTRLSLKKHEMRGAGQPTSSQAKGPASWQGMVWC